VRCSEILRNALSGDLNRVHRRQLDAVWRAVVGLIRGRQLWLTAVGRSLPGSTSEKHRIKAMDRLMGNRGLHANIDRYYEALAKRVLKRTRRPIVAVDWTGLGAHHYQLSASVCWDGRALPLYATVVPKNLYNNARVAKHFLHRLASILPSGCTPILLTDGGFHHSWFEEVAWLAVRRGPMGKLARARSPRCAQSSE
jgi:hypothetical protein